MKTTTIRRFFIVAITLSVFNVVTAQSVASYTITVTSVWDSEANDPIQGNSIVPLPGNAHWSDLVGATHNSNATLLEMGSLASIGVKDVAELGNNTAIMNEVQALINNGDADQFLQTDFQDFAPRTSAVLMNIEVSEDYPLLSLLSMIAPSPDWMIAVNSINLRDGNSWRDEIVMDLFPYDAGTDSGSTYTSANQVTNPTQPISALVNVSPFNDKPIGTITITFNETLSVDSSSISSVSLFPNPSNGIIQINTTNAKVLQSASVFDVLGKKVATIENSNLDTSLNWNLDTLNSGIYLVRMTLSDESTLTKKVVIK